MCSCRIQYSADYLAHHGIKGQRWGIRRTLEQLGHPKKSKKISKSKHEKNDDYSEKIPDSTSTTTSAKSFYKNRHYYTTAQLQQINARKKAEQELKNYIKAESGKKSFTDRIKTGKEILGFINETAKTGTSIATMVKQFKSIGGNNSDKVKKAIDNAENVLNNTKKKK